MSRTVISGIGIISPHGLGREAFWQYLRRRRNAPAPVIVSDAGRHSYRMGFIPEFDEAQFLGVKTIKYLQRSERLAIIGSELALLDAGIEKSHLQEMKVGLAIGSVVGNMRAVEAFEAQVLAGEASYLDPALVPSGLMNSLSGNVSIRHGIRGFHIPVAAGEASSTQAIQFALLELSTDRVDAALAGGVEEIFSMHKPDCSGRKPQSHSESNCDWEEIELSSLKTGAAQLSEAVAILFLESSASAARRGVEPYAECAGFGFSYSPGGLENEEKDTVAMVRAMGMACKDAEVEPGEIDLVCVSSRGGRKDYVEIEAIKRFLIGRSVLPNFVCLKSMFGESLGASGALQVAASALFIQHSAIPSGEKHRRKRGSAEFRISPNLARPKPIKNVLINSFSTDGHRSSLVLKSMR